MLIWARPAPTGRVGDCRWRRPLLPSWLYDWEASPAASSPFTMRRRRSFNMRFWLLPWLLASARSRAVSSSSLQLSSIMQSLRSASASRAARWHPERNLVRIAGTLTRYFGRQFLLAALSVFVGVIVLVALIDYIELMRRTADLADVSALNVAKTSLYRVPQITERILPFCI